MMFGLLGPFGIWELLIILGIVLIIFGPGKLPKVGESLGQAIKGFRKAKEDDWEELESNEPPKDD